MPELASVVAVALLVTLAIGMVRVIAGPTAGDRLMSLLLINTTGVALLLVLNIDAAQGGGLVDAALALAVLGPVTTVAFLVVAGRLRRVESDKKGNHGH